MTPARKSRLPWWSLAIPIVACALLGFALGGMSGTLWMLVFGAALIASVLTAVYHAEVVAHRTGEPFGTLILAIAVTVIEVALIVSLMLAGGDGGEFIARDTVFAAIMIICNGVVGLCVLVGGIRHGEPRIPRRGD